MTEMCDNCSLYFGNQKKVKKIPVKWNSSISKDSRKMIPIKLALDEICDSDDPLISRANFQGVGESTFCTVCAETLTLLYAFNGFLKKCKFNIPLSTMLENFNKFLSHSKETTSSCTQTDQVDNPYIKLRDCLSSLHPKKKTTTKPLQQLDPQPQSQSQIIIQSGAGGVNAEYLQKIVNKFMPVIPADGKIVIIVDDTQKDLMTKTALQTPAVQTTKTIQALEKQKKECEKNSKMCPMCQFHFHSTRLKDIHILNTHRDYPPEERKELENLYQTTYCSICDVWFNELPSQKWGIKYHNEKIHPHIPLKGLANPTDETLDNPEIYRCEQCQEIFKYKEIFNIHSKQCASSTSINKPGNPNHSHPLGSAEAGDETVAMDDPLAIHVEDECVSELKMELEECLENQDGFQFVTLENYDDENSTILECVEVKLEENVEIYPSNTAVAVTQAHVLSSESEDDDDMNDEDGINEERIEDDPDYVASEDDDEGVNTIEGAIANYTRNAKRNLNTAQLKAPKITKGVNSSQCPICKIVFDQKKLLEIHILNHHRDYPAEERAVIAAKYMNSYCSICDEWFNRPGINWGLMGHNLRHHNTAATKRKPRNVVKYYCPKCRGIFRRHLLAIKSHSLQCQGTKGYDASTMNMGTEMESESNQSSSSSKNTEEEEIVILPTIQLTVMAPSPSVLEQKQMTVSSELGAKDQPKKRRRGYESQDCRICGIQLSIENYSEHMKSHSTSQNTDSTGIIYGTISEDEYNSGVCPVCRIKHGDVILMEIHILNVHRDLAQGRQGLEAKYRSSYCNICDLWFSRFHMRRYNNEKSTGIIRHFENLHTVKSDGSNIHISTELNVCRSCNGTFRQKNEFRNHVKMCITK